MTAHSVLRHAFLAACFVTAGAARADLVELVAYKTLDIPVTPFSNMASGYQATNPGFRAVLRSTGGAFIAGGPLTIDSVIRGTTDDASQGSAYGRLVLRVDMIETNPSVSMMNGSYKGKLSICMASDTESRIAVTQCKNLKGNIHPERPFQWLDKDVDFTVTNGNVAITKYAGNTGEGGTSRQLSLAVYHPAYGFAAPGKAFKDYQSPLVLDLDGNGKLALTNVHSKVVHFDMDATGMRSRTGWVAPSDGFLFLDNGTGCVQSGAQLFGEHTGATNGQRTYANGFAALAATLDPNGTGRILPSNTSKLKIWRDVNQDGVCQPVEVSSAQAFIREINVSYETIAAPGLTEDNEIRLVGSYLAIDGTRHLLADVWFKRISDGQETPTPAYVPPPFTDDATLMPTALTVTKRTPVDLKSILQLRTYASSNDYYFTPNLQDGMKVSFSASYGIGGEAAQARGVIVEREGKFLFKMEANPSQNLLLPPGLTFNASNKESLWDLGAYMDLVNRVVFSDPNAASKTATNVYGDVPGAAVVDFRGGTAGKQVSYTDALEVDLTRTGQARFNSNVKVYYGRGIGPVAIEFREDSLPKGTYKFYLGE